MRYRKEDQYIVVCDLCLKFNKVYHDKSEIKSNVRNDFIIDIIYPGGSLIHICTPCKYDYNKEDMKRKIKNPIYKLRRKGLMLYLEQDGWVNDSFKRDIIG